MAVIGTQSGTPAALSGLLSGFTSGLNIGDNLFAEIKDRKKQDLSLKMSMQMLQSYKNGLDPVKDKDNVTMFSSMIDGLDQMHQTLTGQPSWFKQQPAATALKSANSVAPPGVGLKAANPSAADQVLSQQVSKSNFPKPNFSSSLGPNPSDSLSSPVTKPTEFAGGIALHNVALRGY